MSAIRKDYYRTLGVIETADPAVIRAAYKVMIGIYHPDKYIGDKNEAVKKAKEINEAFSVLSDTEKRKAYDEKLKKEKARYEPEANQESDDVRRSQGKAVKSRRLAVFLSICLGGLGAGRFYLGFWKLGVAQVVATVGTLGFAIVWGVLEGILMLMHRIDRDAQNRPLK